MIFPILLPIQIEINYTLPFASKLNHVVVNSSIICVIISVTVVLANLIDYFINGYKNELSAVVLVHIFFSLFVAFALLCIVGAIKSYLTCLKVGFLLWVLLLVIWLTTCCIQFTSWYTIRDICINNRCAESLWLSDFYYRGFEEVDDGFKNTTKPTNNTSLFKPKSMTQDAEKKSSITKVPLKRNYVFISLFVLMFVSFFFFLIFLGSMMYSYHDALCCLSEEDHVVTVPNAAFIFIYPLKAYYEAGSSSSPAEVADDKSKTGTADTQSTIKSGTTNTQSKIKAGATDNHKPENAESTIPVIKNPQTSGK